MSQITDRDFADRGHAGRGVGDRELDERGLGARAHGDHGLDEGRALGGGVVRRGLRTGTKLLGATAAAMMIAGVLERGSPWAVVNAMALAGKRRPWLVSDAFDSEITPAALGTLAGGMLLWGVAYQSALAVTRRRSTIVNGLLSALGAYAFDRFLMPTRLVPTFRRKLGDRGTFAKYAALGIASAAASRR